MGGLGQSSQDLSGHVDSVLAGANRDFPVIMDLVATERTVDFDELDVCGAYV
jgi:hypothetical protein